MIQFHYVKCKNEYHRSIFWTTNKKMYGNFRSSVTLEELLRSGQTLNNFGRAYSVKMIICPKSTNTSGNKNYRLHIEQQKSSLIAKLKIRKIISLSNIIHSENIQSIYSGRGKCYELNECFDLNSNINSVSNQSMISFKFAN